MNEMKFHIPNEMPNTAAPSASLLSLKSWSSSTLPAPSQGECGHRKGAMSTSDHLQRHSRVPGLPEAPEGVVKMHLGGEEAVRKKREERESPSPSRNGSRNRWPNTGCPQNWLPLLIPMGRSEPYLVSIDLSPLIVYKHFWDTLY